MCVYICVYMCVYIYVYICVNIGIYRDIYIYIYNLFETAGTVDIGMCCYIHVNCV